MTAHPRASNPPLGVDTLERLRQISTPTLCTQLFKLGFRNMYLRGVRPLCPDKRMAGEAVTVRFAPAREDRAGYEVLADPAYPQRQRKAERRGAGRGSGTLEERTAVKTGARALLVTHDASPP